MTDRDQVATDALLQLGYPLGVVTRMLAAAQPGAILLTREDVSAWQRARHPPFTATAPPGESSYRAVPAADGALIDRLRQLTEDTPWRREYRCEWPDTHQR